MPSFSIGDSESVYGYMYIDKEIKTLSVSTRYTIRPPTFCSLFGLSNNVATSIEISLLTQGKEEEELRNYTFHVPSQNVEEIIENIMKQVDDFLYHDMPELETKED